MSTFKAPPSTVLADAISTLSKSANHALALVDAEARTQIAKANAETRDAIRERDALKQLLHETQLAEKSLKEEIGAWKAATEKVEITNQHQMETIGQLRQDARQWKDQCLRLEETSRDWKEQFVRVEQERVGYLSRIEELMAERMIYHIPQPLSLNPNLFAPHSGYGEAQELPAPSMTTKRLPTTSKTFQSNGHNPNASLSASDQDSPSEYHYHQHRSRSSKLRPREGETPVSPPSQQGRSRAHTLQAPLSKTPRADPSSSHTYNQTSPTRIALQEDSRPAPRQQIIRRVTATIHTHVKEEVDDDDMEEFVSASASAGPSSPAPVVVSSGGNPSGSRNSTRPNKQSAQDDDDYSEEGDDDQEVRGARKSRRLPSSSSGTEDEGEDELNLMSQTTDAGKEVPSTNTRRATDTPLRPKARTSASKSRGSSGKKRKVAANRPLGGSAVKARRI
ncbi:hypothetical protein FIBSPDRAFT_1036014 [Athelia psychrophila]|uniref:Uncharacterized protein n=1 Tax=Athelia psychrophila TaxID=1759441 RepID=A0A166W6W8_9AGAM|nr:hypothetical protein FIBSPDRAFT_1036014 [Fibularhizoctonia sp. CBS 109695]